MATDNLKWVTAALCTYEVVAITTGKVPTISKFSSRHKWLQPILVGTLTTHLYRYDKS